MSIANKKDIFSLGNDTQGHAFKPISVQESPKVTDMKKMESSNSNNGKVFENFKFYDNYFDPDKSYSNSEIVEEINEYISNEGHTKKEPRTPERPPHLKARLGLYSKRKQNKSNIYNNILTFKEKNTFNNLINNQDLDKVRRCLFPN